MQPRAEEIHRVLNAFVQSKRAGKAEGTRKRSFALVVQGSTPLAAVVRELRETCAMIDIGSSIFTLAYSDILGIDPASSAEGGLCLTVRPGCFASHVAARLRRSAPRSWSRGKESSPLAAHPNDADSYVREAENVHSFGYKAAGGAANSDPTGTDSAEQEIVANDALRNTRR